MKYCDIFAESRGTLPGNGTTYASPRQRNNRGIPGNDVSYAVRRQANSGATMEHITHINNATARRDVFYAVRPEAI
jgi:gamma-glutamyl:cysteine ligase YbdK (ATP-grasp superfamily)